MKLVTTICVVLIAFSLGGCASFPSGGQNLNGFPIDQGCADFHAKSPIYGGNRALAYASNCSQVGM